MDSASTLCLEIGREAAACIQSSQNSAVQRCRELSACGSFKRTAFVRGLAQTTEQIQPLQLVQMINSLESLFGLELLQELLPAAQQAADILHNAACSQEVCMGLMHGSSCSAVAHTEAATAGEALQSVLQLLQSLLVHVFDAAAVSETDSAAQAPQTAGAAVRLDAVCDPGLQQYVLAVLERLQAAATQHEVMAVCLLKAAARCGILCDKEVVARWAKQQLQTHIQAVLPPADTSAASSSPAVTPSRSARALAVTSWPSLALQPLCWALMVPAVLQCMPLQAVLGLLQDSISTAAGSVTGVLQMCDAVVALGACGFSEAAADMVSQSLAASLSAADLRSCLAVLLLAGQLLSRGIWPKGRYLTLQQAGSAWQEGHAASGLPVLLKALNLLLPAADSTVLQAQVDFLRQLQPQLGPVLQAEVSKAEAILRDVLAQQQQLAKQEKQGKQGGKVITPAAWFGYDSYLNQYMRLPAGPDGRRMTQVQIGSWRVTNGAASFCDAFTQQPPEDVRRARACLAYIQELQATGLCKPDQGDRAEAFRASCMAFGVDLSAQTHKAPAQNKHAGPVAVLKGLLDRLPVVVAAGSKPALLSLLARIKEHMQNHIQTIAQPTLAQQQQQQQQHHHQQPASWPSADAPIVKKQRTADLAGSSSITDSQGALDALLTAYAAASNSTATATGPGWSWRSEFLGLIQELPSLHMPLLQRLLGSLRGSAWALEVSPQQALWHGSLLAWLSVSKLQQLAVLAHGSNADITTAPVAAPLLGWRSTSATAGRPAGALDRAACSPTDSLSGCQLVQHLISCSSLANPHARCCAASFWAGYVGCVKTSMAQWCAGAEGPFGSTGTANISPSVLTAITQQAPEAAAAAGAGAQQLVAYMPPQLAALLRQLVSGLTADVQQAAAAGQAGMAGEGGAVSYDVAASALQVCTRALRAPAVKWACQLFGY